MEYGQQMKQARDNALVGLYQNPGYHRERTEKKTIIIDIVDGNLSMGTTPLSTPVNEFNATLHEPLRIDKLSDIYLDSFMTFDAVANTSVAASAFLLSVKEFNIQSNSNVGANFNKIVIYNNAAALNKAVIHKNKKFNYVCSINPTTLTKLTGNITLLNEGTAFGTAAPRFIAEFVIVARD